MFGKQAALKAARVTVAELQAAYMAMLARVKAGERLVLTAPMLGDLVAIVPLSDLERLEATDTPSED